MLRTNSLKFPKAIFFLLFFCLTLQKTSASLPQVQAASYVLIEEETGKVLLSRHSHARRDMASITKIMTAVLALERGDLNQKVRVSYNASNRKYDESTAWLKEGEVLTLRDLLYALLLRSANDAAVAIAESIGGSEEKFVKMMNQKAEDLGLLDTHFGNPHGYYGKDHYSSAYDIAQLSRYAFRFSFFRKAVKTLEYTIPWADSPYDRIMRNHNKLLKKYPFADGIKTGYTKRAGKCLASSATKNGLHLIAVVLNTPDIYGDSIRLFEYGFAHFRKRNLVSKGTIVREERLFLASPRALHFKTGAPLTYVGEAETPQGFSLHIKKRTLSLPIRKGEQVGTLYAYWDGALKKQVPLLAAEAHERNYGLSIIPFLLVFLPAPFFWQRRKRRPRKVKVRTIQ